VQAHEEHCHVDSIAACVRKPVAAIAMIAISRFLHQAHEAAFLELVGELAGRRGEKDEGRDEDGARSRKPAVAGSTPPTSPRDRWPAA